MGRRSPDLRHPAACSRRNITAAALGSRLVILFFDLRNSYCSDSVILPAVFELTGGAGPSANKVFTFFADLEYPGDPKDDPRIARLRSLWISHQRKVHALAMVRYRAELMLRKRNHIRRRRAFAVCAPKLASSVGLDGMHLQDDLVHGASVPRDAFDGLQLSSECGVLDSALV